jgi:hypothetical protein
LGEEYRVKVSLTKINWNTKKTPKYITPSIKRITVTKILQICGYITIRGEWVGAVPVRDLIDFVDGRHTKVFLTKNNSNRKRDPRIPAKVK